MSHVFMFTRQARKNGRCFMGEGGGGNTPPARTPANLPTPLRRGGYSSCAAPASLNRPLTTTAATLYQMLCQTRTVPFTPFRSRRMLSADRRLSGGNASLPRSLRAGENKRHVTRVTLPISWAEGGMEGTPTLSPVSCHAAATPPWGFLSLSHCLTKTTMVCLHAHHTPRHAHAMFVCLVCPVLPVVCMHKARN